MESNTEAKVDHSLFRHSSPRATNTSPRELILPKSQRLRTYPASRRSSGNMCIRMPQRTILLVYTRPSISFVKNTG